MLFTPQSDMGRPLRLGAAPLLGSAAGGLGEGLARAAGPLYGDSMILAECIFSQSAPGEVSRAYFRMLGTCVHRVRTCPDMFRHLQHV